MSAKKGDQKGVVAEANVEMPDFKWLSADYHLKNDCVVLADQVLRQHMVGNIKLYRIDEVTFDGEDESPRQEALENVFASLRIRGVNVVYLILGEAAHVSFYFGVAADLQESQNGINLDEIAKKILAPSLHGNFRGSKVSEVGPKELKRIRELVANAKQKNPVLFSCMEGVPGVTKDKEKRECQGVDRLVDVMLGGVIDEPDESEDSAADESDEEKEWRKHKNDFGLMVVAKPVCNPEEVGKLEAMLDEIYRWIMLKSRQQCQTGSNRGTNTSEADTKGTQEGTAEGKNNQKGKGSAFAASNALAKGINNQEGYTPSGGGRNNSSGTNETGTTSKGRTDNWSYSEGESVQVTRGVMEQVSKQVGSSEGTSTSLSFDVVSKSTQEWVKYFDEVIFPRLDCAKGKGLFVSSTLLFARQEPVLTKLENVVQSIFSGEVGNRSPLRATRLSEDKEDPTRARLVALRNFQQPLIDPTSLATREQCYAATAHSKCLHVDDAAEWKFYAGDWMSTIELGMIAGLPKREVMGLRLREEVEFGLNVGGKEKSPVPLGVLVQGGIPTHVPVTLDEAEFDRHMFVAGVTGSGKTTTCQRILCGSDRHFLVIEPAKTEYRILLRSPQFNDPKHPENHLLVFTIGDDRVAPFRLNPLEFTEGETISSRVDMLMASVTAAFDMEAAIPQLIESAFYASYEKYGWNTQTDKNRYYPGKSAFEPGVYAFPTLRDVLDIMPEIIKRQGFDERLHDEYLGSIRARLQGLLVGAKGLMLNCKRSVSFDDLLDRNVILELEGIRNGAEKSLIIGFVLTNLLVAIKRKFKAGRDGKPNVKVRHITLVEEAHRLMSKFMPGDNANKKHAVEMFADMLAEIRKYGESMIIADQIPNKLTPDVLKNTNIKIVHRIFAQDDKDVIGSTMALTEAQRNFLSNLEVGHAVAFSGDWPKAVHVKVDYVTNTSATEDITNEELRERTLAYYAAQYKSGVFPGLEVLRKRPTRDFLEAYIQAAQEMDLRDFFKDTPDPAKSKDECLDEIAAFEKACGRDVMLSTLADLYLIPVRSPRYGDTRPLTPCEALDGYLEDGGMPSSKYKRYIRTI